MAVGPFTLIAKSCEPGAAGPVVTGGGVVTGGVARPCIGDVPFAGGAIPLGGDGLKGNRGFGVLT